VLYVGDSLGVGTSPYLRQQLDGTALSVDAEIGRPSGVGVDVLRSEIAPEHDAVIFDLGTNDDPATPDALAADLAAARDIAGDRCLVVATLNRPPLNGAPVDALNRGRDLVREPGLKRRAGRLARRGHRRPGDADRRCARRRRRLRAARGVLRGRDRFLLERWWVRLGERRRVGADPVGLARARAR
jgi:hypothetical protein